MSETTGIEWTDSTWNPIRGCSRVSEGCRNCYAESVAYRFSGPRKPYEGLVTIGADGKPRKQWNGQVRLVEKHLLDPLKWGAVGMGEVADFSGKLRGWETTRPRRIFVNSMSDLFHENVPDEWIDKIFAVMALCPQHTFQILTKRPQRMREYIKYGIGGVNGLCFVNGALGELLDDACNSHKGRSFPRYAESWPLKNIQLGVSVEDQKTADERIPLLLQTPAAVRFISAEPLLGSVWLHDFAHHPKLDWVICGGESGPGARPMHPKWARLLRDQCAAAGVPFFFKQWGEWAPPSDGEFYQTVPTNRRGKKAVYLTRDGQALTCFHHPGEDAEVMAQKGKKAAGSLLDGVEWKQFPEAR